MPYSATAEKLMSSVRITPSVGPYSTPLPVSKAEVFVTAVDEQRQVDVRILAATHRDLAVMVRDGEFRADLYYRLRVLPLRVPALRERREDIPLLTDALLANLSRRHPGPTAELAPETLACLTRYAWPGNVRELANALEYALVHVEGTLIQPRHLPPEIMNSAPEDQDARTRGPGTPIQPFSTGPTSHPVFCLLMPPP